MRSSFVVSAVVSLAVAGVAVAHGLIEYERLAQTAPGAWPRLLSAAEEWALWREALVLRRSRRRERDEHDAAR